MLISYMCKMCFNWNYCEQILDLCVSTTHTSELHAQNAPPRVLAWPRFSTEAVIIVVVCPEYLPDAGK